MTRAPSEGFPAVAGTLPWLLILGSLPGRRSLAVGEYYAHPRNAFWSIAAQLFGVDSEASYKTRLAALTDAGVALWDVLAASRREGSLDSALELETASVNDFDGFLRRHPSIALVACNGRMATTLFERRVLPGLSGPAPPLLSLPSTSPAHAAMSRDEKLARWARVLDYRPTTGH